MNKTQTQSNTTLLRGISIRDLVSRDDNLLRLIMVLIGVFVIMSLLRPSLFLRGDNFISMAYQFPEFGIMSIAMMLCMLTGGVDLSIVGVANLSAILCGVMLARVVPEDASPGFTALMILLGVLMAVVVGLLCGVFNGVVISKIGIAPILATLGSMQLFTGIALVVTKGKTVTGLPIMYSKLGNAAVGGIIPVPLIIFITCAVAVSIMLSKASFGIKIYLMGTNPTASKFSGIRNTVITIRTYMYSGILASVAGLIMMARTNSARADFGSSYTLLTVLIAVLGGVNPNGGFGTVGGVTVAVLILQFLSSGFNMFPFISNFIKDLIWGLVLIVVMVINYFSNKRAEKKSIEKLYKKG